MKKIYLVGEYPEMCRYCKEMEKDIDLNITCRHEREGCKEK